MLLSHNIQYLNLLIWVFLTMSLAVLMIFDLGLLLSHAQSLMLEISLMPFPLMPSVCIFLTTNIMYASNTGLVCQSSVSHLGAPSAMYLQTNMVTITLGVVVTVTEFSDMTRSVTQFSLQLNLLL